MTLSTVHYYQGRNLMGGTGDERFQK